MLGTSTNFSAIGPTPTRGLTPSPCYRAVVRGKGYVLFCHFLAPDSNLANIVWGQLSQSCAFDGLHAGTAWRFPPECTLGVDPSATLADSSNPMRSSASQGWAFPTYTGSPGVFAGTVSAGSAGPVGDDAAVVPNASASRSSGDGAVVRLRGTVAVPRRLLLTRARVVFDRLLFERRGAGELVRHHSGRRLPPLILSRRGGPSGRVFASPRRGGPEVAVRLRRSGQGLLSFRLKARDVRLPSPPTACSGTRPEVDLATGPIPLHTRLRIDDGRRRPLVISLRPQWVCRRDRLGNVRRLVLSRPTFHRPAGRSPAVAVRGPRRVAAGKSATYRITVRNRRRTPAYDVRIHAVLPPGFRPRRVRGARVGGRQVVWRLHALRPGRSRSVRLRMRIPRSLAPRRCLGIVADAIDTRAGRGRICIRVRGPARRAPRRARP